MTRPSLAPSLAPTPHLNSNPIPNGITQLLSQATRRHRKLRQRQWSRRGHVPGPSRSAHMTRVDNGFVSCGGDLFLAEVSSLFYRKRLTAPHLQTIAHRQGTHHHAPAAVPVGYCTQPAEQSTLTEREERVESLASPQACPQGKKINRTTAAPFARRNFNL